MAITLNTSDALKVEMRSAIAILSFSTDATAGVSSTISAANGGNSGTLASAAGFIGGDAVTIANGAADGTSNWYQVILGNPSGNNVSFNVPGVRNPAGVSAQPITRWERFETRKAPKKITIENQTNGDKYEWNSLMAIRTAWKTTAAGVRSLISGNAIWPCSSCFYVHPDILPVSSSYICTLEY